MQAIQAVECRVFYMMLLTNTKIYMTVYFQNWLRYKVTFLTVQLSSDGGFQGGVKIVMSERPVGWEIESTYYHRSKVVSCLIVTELKRTPLVGAYLPQLTLDHLPDLEEALKRFRDPIVLGDLNVDLDEARILQSQRVSDLLVENGLIDLVHHFRQRHRLWNMKAPSPAWYCPPVNM